MTTFRPPRAFLLGLLVLLLAVAVSNVWRGEFLWPVAAVLAVVYVCVIWRTWRMAMILTPEGVELRNVLRDRRFRWDEIAGAEARAVWFAPRHTVYILLRTGKAVRSDAFGGLMTKPEAVHQVISAVNASVHR